MMDENALQVFAIVSALACLGLLLTLPKISPSRKNRHNPPDQALSGAPEQALAEERVNRWSVHQVARSAGIRDGRI
jgi:hypothetical protein